MALLFTGTKTKSAGIVSAVLKLSKQVNLKPAKRMTIKFDPFHENSSSIRQFSYYINGRGILQTNPSCRIRTEVISSQTEDPRIEIVLENGETLLIKCHHLNVAEMFQLIVKHVSALVPKPKPLETFTTKSKRK